MMCSCRDSFHADSAGFFRCKCGPLCKPTCWFLFCILMEMAMETIHSESYSLLIEQHAHDQEKPNVLEFPVFRACGYDDRSELRKPEFGDQNKALIKTKSQVSEFLVFYARECADRSDLSMTEFGAQNKALIQDSRTCECPLAPTESWFARRHKSPLMATTANFQPVKHSEENDCGPVSDGVEDENISLQGKTIFFEK